MNINSNTISKCNDPLSCNLGDFICWMEFRGWSPRTIETYTTNIRKFIEYLRQETDARLIDEINLHVFNRYQHYLYHIPLKSGKSISISGLHTKLVSIRSFLKFLYSNKQLNIDPDFIIKLPIKRQPLPKNIISDDQIARLMAEHDLTSPLGVRNKSILELLYASGIRNTELRSLAVYDVDPDQLQLTIRKGKHQKDRLIPLGEVAAEWIDKYLRFVRGGLCSGFSSHTLFLSKSGRQITRGNLIWIISRYAKRAGLGAYITPHTLRHTCATHVLRHGADIRYIQEHLGHASVATTQIYTRVFISDLKKVFRQTHPRAVIK